MVFGRTPVISLGWLQDINILQHTTMSLIDRAADAMFISSPAPFATQNLTTYSLLRWIVVPGRRAYQDAYLLARRGVPSIRTI